MYNLDDILPLILTTDSLILLYAVTVPMEVAKCSEERSSCVDDGVGETVEKEDWGIFTLEVWTSRVVDGATAV